MRVGELLLERGEFDKALEAADKAVLFSRARYLVLSAMDLKLRIYQKMDWENEARQVAGYLIDQKYVHANVPALFTLMARADARAGKTRAPSPVPQAVAAAADPEEATAIDPAGVRHREGDRPFPAPRAARVEEDEESGPPVPRAGEGRDEEGFHGWRSSPSTRRGNARECGQEAAEHLYRVEKIVSGRPKSSGSFPCREAFGHRLLRPLRRGDRLEPRPWSHGQNGGPPVVRWADTAGDPDRARAEFSAATADRTLIGFLGR
jgi:hypothetical protein